MSRDRVPIRMAVVFPSDEGCLRLQSPDSSFTAPVAETAVPESAGAARGASGNHPTMSVTPTGRPRGAPHRWIYVGAAVAAVVLIVTVGVVVAVKRPPSSPSAEILLPAGTLTSISNQQFAAVTFVSSSAGILNGTYSTESTIVFYLLTPQEYLILLTKNNLTGYSWTYQTPGIVPIAYLALDFQPGSWDFVMENQNATTASAVGWLTALTLTPN